MMNQKKAPTKISNMMKTMNKLLYSVFAFQFIILVIWSTLSIFWMMSNSDVHTYLDIGGEIDMLRWFK
jgi:phospholipid-transporting ATPase